MDEKKINKIKKNLNSPISTYKFIISDFHMNLDNSSKETKINNKIEQFIFRMILKKIRNLKKITQKHLAEITGKKSITIQAYENDRLKISDEFIYLVIKKINLTKKEFINNILFSDEFLAVLYTLIQTLIYNNSFQKDDEILNFIEKIYSIIIIKFFEDETEKSTLNKDIILDKNNETVKKEYFKYFDDTLEKEISSYIMNIINFNKKENEISIKKIKEITDKNISYLKFLLKENKIID